MFWKSCLGAVWAPSWSGDDEEEPEGGRVARKAEAWLGAPLENARAGLCLAGSALRRLPSSGPWDTPAARGSAPRPGHQVVEDEEDEDERRGHGEEQPAVVPAGARHAGEALRAARQQPRHAQEIRVLAGNRETHAGGLAEPRNVPSWRDSQGCSRPRTGHPRNPGAALGLLPSGLLPSRLSPHPLRGTERPVSRFPGPYHAVQVAVLLLSVLVNIQSQLQGKAGNGH